MSARAHPSTGWSSTSAGRGGSLSARGAPFGGSEGDEIGMGRTVVGVTGASLSAAYGAAACGAARRPMTAAAAQHAHGGQHAGIRARGGLGLSAAGGGVVGACRPTSSHAVARGVSAHVAPTPAGGGGTAGAAGRAAVTAGGAPDRAVATISAPTTTPPKELMAEAMRTLHKSRCALQWTSPFVASCERHGLHFLVEVAATDISQSYFVIRLELQKGDASLFRELAARILPAIKL